MLVRGCYSFIQTSGVYLRFMNAYKFVKSLRSAVAWGMGPLNKVFLIVRLLKNFKCLIVSYDLHVKQELRSMSEKSSSGHLGY